MGPNQISPTDVGLGPIISFRCRSSCYGAVVCFNRRDPWPNIFNRRRGSHSLCQVTSTSLVRRLGFSRLFLNDVEVQRIFPNRHCNSLKYFQRTPGLSKLAPWPLRGCLKYWLLVVLRHARRKLPSFLWSKYCFSSFCGLVPCARTPFKNKITVKRWYYPFRDYNPINPED